MTKQRIAIIVFAIALLSPVTIHAGSKTHGLNEDAALDLLLRTLKKDHVYDKRISLDCVTFTADEATRIYFEIVLRENHNAKCGGDPDTTPIIDRYRVYRASGKIELFDAPADSWRAYNGEHR